jgi:hypothetical protein
MSFLALLLAATVRYDVQAGEAARVLAITVELPAGVEVVAFEPGLGRYAEGRAVRRGGLWSEVAGTEDRIAIGGPGPLAVRYRFRLRDLAFERRQRTTFEQGGALVAAPSTWLARPSGRGGRFTLRVRTPPGTSFATGLFPGSEPGTYEADLRVLYDAPYSAFGPFDIHTQAVPGGTVALAVLPGSLAVGQVALARWAREAALDVTAYYGRLPVPRVQVLVVPGGRRAVGYGTTMGNGGASILVWVGPEAREVHLERDWVLTHEMVHLALPNLSRAHFWLEEGIATYVEPIARARRGRLAAAEVWRGLADGLPKGLPAAGDGGLDGTRSWGRTYWGGALFSLLADVALREATANRAGLGDALRGVVDAGGSIAVRWEILRLLSVADAATGTAVLGDLYRKMGPSAVAVDLDALWARLGVDAGGELREDAPLAGLRRAITGAEAPAARDRRGALSRGPL